MPVRVEENSQTKATTHAIRKNIAVRVSPSSDLDVRSATARKPKTYGRSRNVLPRSVRTSIRSKRLDEPHHFDRAVAWPQHEFPGLLIVTAACLLERIVLAPRRKRRILNAN